MNECVPAARIAFTTGYSRQRSDHSACLFGQISRRSASFYTLNVTFAETDQYWICDADRIQISILISAMRRVHIY